MYIRRTTIKSRAVGEPYTSHRLVESIRTDNGVRQRTIINLGRHFEVPREQWPALAQRIEHIISGQRDLVPPDLDPQWEAMAQRYSAGVIRARARHEDTLPGAPDYHTGGCEQPGCAAPAQCWGRTCIAGGVAPGGFGQKARRAGL